MLFVVTDTAYHKRVPILLGTNVIGSFWKDFDNFYSNDKLLLLLGKWLVDVGSIYNTSRVQSSPGEVVSLRSVTKPAGNKTVVIGAALCQQISVCLDEASVTSLSGGLIVSKLPNTEAWCLNTECRY